MLKNFRLSSSQVNTYKQCPKKWRFRYIEKIREPSGYPAIVGKFSHSVLESLMRLSNKKRTEQEAKQLARKIFDDEISKAQDYLELDLEEEAAKKFRWEVWEAIKGLWKLENPEEVNVASIEKRLTTELGGIKFLGFIDRVDNTPNGISILDYKSGKFPANKTSEKEKLDQVFLYAAAYEAIEGVKPNDVKIYFTTLGKEISAEVTKDETDAVVEDLVKTHERIQLNVQADSFDTKTGPLCGWCFYIDKCEQGKNYIMNRHNNGNLKDTAPAIKILGLEKLAS